MTRVIWHIDHPFDYVGISVAMALGAFWIASSRSSQFRDDAGRAKVMAFEYEYVRPQVRCKAKCDPLRLSPTSGLHRLCLCKQMVCWAIDVAREKQIAIERGN